MDHRAEYNNFLLYFHARHGFLQPPSYDEWLFNISRTAQNMQCNIPNNTFNISGTTPNAQSNIQRHAFNVPRTGPNVLSTFSGSQINSTPQVICCKFVPLFALRKTMHFLRKL